MFRHRGFAWPALRGVVAVLLFAALHAGATVDFRDISRQSDILKEISLNYEQPGHSRESRESSDCNTTESFVGNCNLDCQCVDGKWRCCRLRKNINMMTEAEITRFTNAFVTMANNPRYSPGFNSLSWSHAIFVCSFVMLNHGTIFSEKPNLYNTAIGYHNLLIFALENLLRLVDCGVTVPYWDVTTSAGKTWAEIIPKGFGTSGVGKDMCVQDGPFRQGAFTVPKFVVDGKPLPYSSCVQRNLSTTERPFSYQMFETLLTVTPDKAILLESSAFQFFDKNFHNGLGGSSMGLTAALDPLLYLLHNYGSKIIADYQLQGGSYFTGGGRWNASIPISAFPWFKEKDFLDCLNLPNGVCTRYAPSMNREEAIKIGYYAGLEVPRKDHVVHPYKSVRELALEKNDAKTFADLLVTLAGEFKSLKLTENGLWISPTWRKDRSPKNLFKLTKKEHVGELCAAYQAKYPAFLNFNVTNALAELV